MTRPRSFRHAEVVRARSPCARQYSLVGLPGAAERQRRTWWIAIAAIVVVAALVVAIPIAMWIEDQLPPQPVTVGADAVKPLPATMRVIYDDTYPCVGAGADPGWNWRFLLVTADADDVATHLASLGYGLQEPSSYDYAPRWATRAARRKDVLVWVGPYTRETTRSSVTGPPSAMDDAAATASGGLAVVSLEPTNVTCEQ